MLVYYCGKLTFAHLVAVGPILKEALKTPMKVMVIYPTDILGSEPYLLVCGVPK